MLNAETVDQQETYFCLYFDQEIVEPAIDFSEIFVLRELLACSIDDRTDVENFYKIFELELYQVLSSSAFVHFDDFLELSLNALVVADIPQYLFVVFDELFQVGKGFCE